MKAKLETVLSADATPTAFERTGDGAPVILIGGAYNDRSTVARLATTLAPHVTAVAYDRRGRGASGGGGDAGDRAVEREIEDLAAVIDGSESPQWLRAATRAVAGAIPGARYVTLEGQDHGVLHHPEALGPVLLDLLAS